MKKGKKKKLKKTKRKIHKRNKFEESCDQKKKRKER